MDVENKAVVYAIAWLLFWIRHGKPWRISFNPRSHFQ